MTMPRISLVFYQQIGAATHDGQWQFMGLGHAQYFFKGANGSGPGKQICRSPHLKGGVLFHGFILFDAQFFQCVSGQEHGFSMSPGGRSGDDYEGDRFEICPFTTTTGDAPLTGDGPLTGDVFPEQAG